jgi:hypothetical protein
MLIERAATLTGYLARLDGDALSPAGLSDLRRREYLAADGALRRTLREIGLEGAPAVERGLTLADYISAAPRRVRTAPADPPGDEGLPSDPQCLSLDMTRR